MDVPYMIRKIASRCSEEPGRFGDAPREQQGTGSGGPIHDVLLT